MRELEATNYSAAGRKYGVTDNAVRKWVRTYRREAGLERDRRIREAGFTFPN